MKVIEHAEYNSDHPEYYIWGRIDSIIYSNLGSSLSNWILHDLKTVDRCLVPGLRKTLNIIAGKAEV